VNHSIDSIAGRRVVVEVPATIANLGAGYDCLGLAVDLALHVSILARRDPARSVELDVRGEGAGELPADASNRLIQALGAGLLDAGFEDLNGLGWTVEMINTIPLARGLGSSAAATVAGALAARALLDLPDAGDAADAADAVLRVASKIEGHPDNVSPAVLGGFTATFATEADVRAFRFDAPDSLRVVLFVPELRLATSDMREVLPIEVPRVDAVANLSRVAAGVAGIASGDWTVLDFLTEDRLHEPYRAAVYPQLPALVAAARSAGAIGACLAGAGSSIAAFALDADAEQLDAIGDALVRGAADADLPGWIRILAPSNAGARVVSVT
jgi:homoserine kinase